MKRIVLENGLTIVYKKRDTDSVTVEVMVKAGCLYEPTEIMGISHFLEHMLFNGTTNRTQLQIASEVENLGAEMNAATGSDRTYYYIKIIKKHFDVALDVMSDMIINSNFPIDLFEREKGIVKDEINMVFDTPRHYQWNLFHESLYQNHPGRNRVLGTKETIKNLSREALFDYYHKMYVPNNLVVTIVGNVEDVFEKVKEKFGKLERKEFDFPKIEKIENKHNLVIQSRDIKQSYLIIGYSTPKRNEKESLTFDIIRTILGKGQSGWIFDEIRNKRGLAYEAGVHVDASIDTGFLAVYVNTHKKNFEKVKKIIFKQFERLQTITQEDLINAKTYIEGDFVLDNEDTEDMATEISFRELCGNANTFENYTKQIWDVSIDEVKEVAKKYLTQDYSEAIIEQKE